MLAAIVAVVAFSLGALLASGVAPALPATRAGRRTAALVSVLTGAAAAMVAVAVVRAAETAGGKDAPFIGTGSPRAVADTLNTGIWAAGGLLAAAAAVHLLAPQHTD